MSTSAIQLQKGLPLFRQQFIALIKKNALLSWRQKRATFLQLFSSFFFIFLMYCTDKALSSRLSSTTSYQNVYNPEPLISPPIPPCEDKFFIKMPCFDFVWSGNSSARIRSIVRRIMANNLGRRIPESKVKSFKTPKEVDAWLGSEPMRCPGALHFAERNSTVISYGIQTNSTPVSKRGKFEDPTFKFQIPLQIAAEREIARSLIGDPNFSWTIGFKEFAHPATESFSIVGSAGPTYILATAMFGFVFQISSLVTEKELKLRQAMSIMGLCESAYWFSWLAWETFLALLASVLIVLFGMMFQFDFFLHNSFSVIFLVFFLFQFNMTGLAFMISTFINRSSSATTVGYSIFIIGFLTQLVTTFGFPYSNDYSNSYRVIWSLFPPNLLAEALNLLGDATATYEDQGISWKERAECPFSDPNCTITIDAVYKWLLTTFFLWFILAVYHDNIIPNVNGIRKSLIYFLKPSYWTGSGGNRMEDGASCTCTGSIPPLDNAILDDDVLKEESTVRQQASQNLLDPNVAVQIRGLTKTYPGTRQISCLKCQRKAPHHAVKGIWMNFPKNQLFCLLGPNGAGKTTVINCLTGIIPATDGDAIVCGYSIRSSVGMSNIQRIIGVCPQFDILWDALSAEEHLNLFASIKGLPPATIKNVSKRSLDEVKLNDEAKVQAGNYSGGMKRRLSVAIALIGDPSLVILDEPTTGMDPITRRHVWDIIQNAKNGRAVVLTTHSMEEADILGDRIAIMAKGRLRCIGTSIRLKSRFGTGYIVGISFLTKAAASTSEGNPSANVHQQELVKQFFRDRLDVLPKEEHRSFLTFVISREKESHLSSFFAELQEREEELGILDIQLGMTTLEEVFLSTAKTAELEDASEAQSLLPLTMDSGAVILVPRGVQFIGIPGTASTSNPKGLMVEVYWEIDEAGALFISGHSPQTPVPANARLRQPPVTDSSATPTRRHPPTVTGLLVDTSPDASGV